MEPTVSEFMLMFSIATVGMLLLAIAIVVFVMIYQKRMLREQLKRQQLESAYQQRMLEAALASQEEERKRVAADLHDSVGAMLSTIRLSLHAIVRQETASANTIGQTKYMLDETIETVRRISRDLMPASLEKFGLSQAVQDLCERINSVSSIKCSFHENGANLPLEKSKEILVYRIVQELANNAIKHAQASRIEITLNWMMNQLHMVVQDDGIGFDFLAKKADSHKSLGLYNIENRARLLQAQLNFEKTPDKGTKVELTVPVFHEKEAQGLYRR